MPFLEVRVTSYDSSKKEWKSHRNYIGSNFQKWEKSMKKGDLYFLGKYTYILIIMDYTLIFDKLVSH